MKGNDSKAVEEALIGPMDSSLFYMPFNLCEAIPQGFTAVCYSLEEKGSFSYHCNIVGLISAHRKKNAHNINTAYFNTTN